MHFDKIELYFQYSLMLVRGVLCQLVHFKVPKLLFMGRGARIYGFSHLRFRQPMKLGNHSTIDLRFTNKVVIGSHFVLGDFSTMRASGSQKFKCQKLLIGNHVTFGPYSCIGGGFGLSIGNDVMAGPYVSIHPENHIFRDLNTPIRKQGINGVGIKIGSDIWIGTKATILDGARVADGSIIAAGALVVGSFPPLSILGGLPARVLKKRGSESPVVRPEGGA